MANEIRQLVDNMGKIPKDLKVELRPGLRKAGEVVRDEARRNAAWSKRIPAATRVSVGFSKRNPGVAIQVNKKRAPHARPFEHGGALGTFRHPVFGHRDRWVSQRARPFLHSALESKGDEAAKQIEQVVDRVIRKDFEK